jgi:hypothetical protein
MSLTAPSVSLGNERWWRRIAERSATLSIDSTLRSMPGTNGTPPGAIGVSHRRGKPDHELFGPYWPNRGANRPWLDEPRQSLCQPSRLKKPKPRLDERWLPTAYPDNLFACKTLPGWHVLAVKLEDEYPLIGQILYTVQ